MFLNEEERLETLKACRDCPMCHHIDTVVAITGRETNTPRGRAMALWGLEKEIISWETDGIADILYGALLDGLPKEWCEGNYDYDELIIDGRRRLVDMRKAPDEVSRIALNIRTRKNPFGVKEQGVASLVAREGFSPQGKPEVCIFFGSSARIQRTSVALSLIKIMRFLEIPFETLEEETDSGFLLYQLGDFKTARDQANDVSAMLEKSEAKKLVTLSASDYRMFTTRYSRFGALIPQGMTVMHVTEFLCQLLNEGKLAFKKKSNNKVTYHDPCNLARFTYVIEPPRALLKALVGLNFLEMEWNGKKAHCCGGGGGLPYTNREISEKAARMRVEEALKTGAKILASSCPECEHVLSQEVRNNEIVVRDIVELIANSL